MFIHETKNWTSFRWDAHRLAEGIAGANEAIGYLAGRLSMIGFEDRMLAAVETVTHDVVCSSEIEGAFLNSEEVRSSVARRLGVPVLDKKESTHYVDGVVEMMLDAVMNYDDPLTYERLFGWHAAFFPTGRSWHAPIRVGTYRTEAREVVSGMFGRERVHYRASEAERVPREMDRFLVWLNEERIPPSLLKSAIAHFWFVCIHPFDDGNGRIARAISDRVLSQATRSQWRFFSLSMQIDREKKNYYRILEQTQRGDGDLTEWLEWYLGCVQRAAVESNTLLSDLLNKAIFWKTHAEVTISERQRTVLNVYLDGYEGKLTVKNWSKLAKVSPDTAARDVKELVEKKLLSPVQGRVRDVSYRLNYLPVDVRGREFSDMALTHRADGDYLTGVYKGERQVEERISEADKERFERNEISMGDLVCKYFAYLLE